MVSKLRGYRGHGAGEPINDGFFRLYGDISGDGNVNSTDFVSGILPAFRASVGDEIYSEDLDHDGDGTVSFVDFSSGFSPRFGTGRPAES